MPKYAVNVGIVHITAVKWKMLQCNCVKMRLGFCLDIKYTDCFFVFVLKKINKIIDNAWILI